MMRRRKNEAKKREKSEEERKKPLSFRVRPQPRSGEYERGICCSPEAIHIAGLALGP
jgi:hypothetical protein